MIRFVKGSEKGLFVLFMLFLAVVFGVTVVLCVLQNNDAGAIWALIFFILTLRIVVR